MSEILLIKKAIIQILASHADGRLRGASLAVVLRKQSSFDTKSHGKLSAFVRAHCQPDVLIVDSAGRDVVYGLSSKQLGVSPSVSPLRPLPPAIWKTFNNPATSDRLWASKQTGELKVSSDAEEWGDPWVRVQACSGDDYLGFARRWIEERVPEAEKKRVLTNSLENPAGTAPSGPFADAVKALGLVGNWKQFRTASVVHQLSQRLTELKVPPTPDRDRIDEELPAPPAQAIDTRAVALALIGHMSESDLRGMSVPFGAVLDFLRNRPV